MLICDNLLTTSDVDFNYRKYLNKYIYFVVDRIDMWRYGLIYKDKFSKRNNDVETIRGSAEPLKTRTKIYVEYPIWSPDKSELSMLSIQLNGISKIAYGIFKEDLTGCWIDAEFHCNLSYKSVISFKKNKDNEIKFKLGKHPIEGYDAYGIIICIDPLTVYCGDIIFTIDNSSFESPIELSPEKHLNKYIYFKPSGFHITSYEIISSPDSKIQMPINIKIWADINSTGLFTEIGEPLYQEDTDITDETWSELQRLVSDYEEFIPCDDKRLKEYKEKIPEFDASGLALLEKIKKEWPIERKTGREINFRYYSEGLMKFIE
ncbi:MAG TPA: hypothetical protein VHO28_10610 [Ignavibacteriales bacterium]|nr:hypothetical protein [Ignavibacteriales bacterium]